MLAFACTLAACSASDEDEPVLPSGEGVAYVRITRSVAAAFDSIGAALEALPPVSVVARLDHAANAASVEAELDPTRIIFFGNPALGTPLMQRDQRAGIDLPQHMLVYEHDDTNRVYATYNSTDYLSQRHGLDGVATLSDIGGALKTVAEGVTGGTVALNSASGVGAGEGLVTVTSAFDVPTTFARLKSAVEAAGPLSVVFELDHAANAASVGMTLRPTRLLAFGNPALGTKLMRENQGIGLDLPQKMLVWEDESGITRLTYNAPSYLAARHGIPTDLPEITTIADALAGLAEGATQPD